MSHEMQPFQSPVLAMLLGVPGPKPAWSTRPGFAVHASTILRGAIDALAANVPTVHRLLGDDAFDVAAGAFVRATPPRRGFDRYGAGLPEFLAAHPPLAELDHLPGVAALDLAWIESHLAAAAPVLASSDVFALTAEQLLHGRLVPHPAARWLRFEAPAFTIWRHGRAGRQLEHALPWRPESALLTRPERRVRWCAIDAGEARFLAACARGSSCDDALESVLAEGIGFDLALSLPRLVEAGAFTRIDADAP
jgi:putative DNA-binding protein